MDLFDVVIVSFAAFIIGVVVGEFRQGYKFIAKVSKDPQSMIDLLTNLKTELDRLKEAERLGAPADAVEVKLENHNGMYYCFKQDNDQFLGQGTDAEELIKEISKKLGQNVWAKRVNESSQTA